MSGLLEKYSDNWLFILAAKTIYVGLKRQNFLCFIKDFWIEHPLCIFILSSRFKICLKIFLAWYTADCNPDIKLLTKNPDLLSSFVYCPIFACTHFVYYCYSSCVVWKYFDKFALQIKFKWFQSIKYGK